MWNGGHSLGRKSETREEQSEMLLFQCALSQKMCGENEHWECQRKNNSGELDIEYENDFRIT